MNKYLYILLLLAAPVLSGGCKKGGDDAPENKPPECEITAPADGQTVLNNAGLFISGRGSDPEDNLTLVRLTVGGAVVGAVTEVPFEYIVPAQDLLPGALTISLYVEDAEGLSATDEITINIKTDESADISISPERLEFGYWTEERELTVVTDSDWTMTIPSSASELFAVYDNAKAKWETKSTLSGKGNKVIRIRMRANEQFADKDAEIKIETAASVVSLKVKQEASPDMVMMLEDENLRIAASLAIIIYEADLNEDGKLSAYEAENDLDIFGIDAGAYDVISIKGIEYFPNLKHLDINSNPGITEVDLSGNPNIRSLHVNNCAGLKNLDLSPVPELIELGCDFALYVNTDIGHLKENMITVAVLNRDPGHELSTLDFSDFPNLLRLYVYDNGLTGLNIEGCPLWLLSAGGNNFKEIDLSGVDRDSGNFYMLTNCPQLKTIYVWKGFARDYYALFSIDEGVDIVEKE